MSSLAHVSFLLDTLWCHFLFTCSLIKIWCRRITTNYKSASAMEGGLVNQISFKVKWWMIRFVWTVLFLVCSCGTLTKWMLPRLSVLFTNSWQRRLLKTADTPLIEHEEVHLVPTQSLHPCTLVSLVQDGTLHVNQRETNTPTQPQSLWSTMASCLQNMLCQLW